MGLKIALKTLKRLTLDSADFWHVWGDDGRKLGLASIIAGLLGIFSNSDKITQTDSTVLLSVGILIWLFSAILFSVNKNKVKQ